MQRKELQCGTSQAVGFSKLSSESLNCHSKWTAFEKNKKKKVLIWYDSCQSPLSLINVFLFITDCVQYWSLRPEGDKPHPIRLHRMRSGALHEQENHSFAFCYHVFADLLKSTSSTPNSIYSTFFKSTAD